MTEAEWLTSNHVYALMSFVRDKGQRKLRLAACGYCRLAWNALDETCRQAVEIAELFADGEATTETFLETESRIRPLVPAIRASYSPYQLALHALATPPYLHAAAATAGTCVIDLLGYAPVPLGHIPRDVFGNPFRPVALDPAWLTSTVIALARQMYESRDFSAMPILADALQDAGCDNNAILNHCRDPKATHVRGCWVIDLLLGKREVSP